MPTFRPVIAVKDIPEQGFTSVEVDEISLIVGQINGDYYVFLDRCPHAMVPLRTSKLSGSEITCSRHGWVFDVLSGDSVPGPTAYCLRKFPHQIQGDQFCVGELETL